MRTHYMGKPITDWWAGRGRRCSRCIASPVPKPRPQMILVSPPPAPPTPPPPPVPAPTLGRIEEQFEVFHENNPHVYEALVREGRSLLARGHRKLGISMLYERLRWQVYMETHDDEHDFKLPNNYRSYYARLIMRQEPDFEGVFALAELRSTR